MRAVSFVFAAIAFAGLTCVSAATSQLSEPSSPTILYPASADGFRQQFNAALQAYRDGKESDGNNLVERLSLPPTWFEQAFSPEQAAQITQRYQVIFPAYANSTENTLKDFADMPGSELQLTEITSTPDPGKVSYLQPNAYTLQRDVPLFRFRFAELLNRRETASWEYTYVYEDGAFRFIGGGAWPLWLWPQATYRENPNSRFLKPPAPIAGYPLAGQNGIGVPTCLQCKNPSYSEKARQAHVEGTVALRCVVGVDGRASMIEVVHGLGFGLDEKAIEALRNWQFKPALYDKGAPVAVTTSVEIHFRFLK